MRDGAEAELAKNSGSCGSCQLPPRSVLHVLQHSTCDMVGEVGVGLGSSVANYLLISGNKALPTLFESFSESSRVAMEGHKCVPSFLQIQNSVFQDSELFFGLAVTATAGTTRTSGNLRRRRAKLPIRHSIHCDLSLAPNWGFPRIDIRAKPGRTPYSGARPEGSPAWKPQALALNYGARGLRATERPALWSILNPEASQGLRVSLGYSEVCRQKRQEMYENRSIYAYIYALCIH